MARRHRLLFWGFWLVLAGLWLVLNVKALAALSPNIFALRETYLQFTGVMAAGAMSLAMMLSLRPRIPEWTLGGLDKMYRLHKWLGIGALSFATLHWLGSQAPGWAIGLGLVQRPARGGGGSRPEITDPIRAFLGSFHRTAEGLGQWAFYAVAILLLIALIRLIPYRWFRYSHRLVPLAYLVVVFHAVVLFDYAMWATPIGILLALLLAGGSYAAVTSIVGRIGASRRVPGEILEMRHFPGVKSLQTVVRVSKDWPGHKAGQFAFATSNSLEGAHPYTIASAWDPADPKVTFIAKELGDHTTGLVDRLKVGQKVKIEGPYGCFTFDDGCPHQIWIGAGIGITPFVARMKELASETPGTRRPEIDIFHTTREVDEQALERLAEDARAARIRLHLLIDAQHGRLTGARIRELLPKWREASLWFCGPIKFGAALRADFAAEGMAIDERFHQELFELR